MKNNKQLLVVEKGKVRIRNWKIGSDEKWNPNPNLYKTRICNFIRFHPNGCPRDSSDCPFAHNDSEKVKVDRTSHSKGRSGEMYDFSLLNNF